MTLYNGDVIEWWIERSFSRIDVSSTFTLYSSIEEDWVPITGHDVVVAVNENEFTFMNSSGTYNASFEDCWCRDETNVRAPIERVFRYVNRPTIPVAV